MAAVSFCLTVMSQLDAVQESYGFVLHSESPLMASAALGQTEVMLGHHVYCTCLILKKKKMKERKKNIYSPCCVVLLRISISLLNGLKTMFKGLRGSLVSD